MAKTLFITTVKDFGTGGSVFTESLIKIFGVFSDVDVLYCVEGRVANNKLVRILRTMYGLFLKRLPIKIAYYYSNFLSSEIRSLDCEKYSYIVIDHLEAAWVLPFLNRCSARIVYVSHNDEASLFRSRFVERKNVNSLLRAFFLREVDRLDAFQFKVLRESDVVVSVSSENFLYEYCKPIRVLPCFSYERRILAMDSSLNCRHRSSSSKLVVGYLGNLAWWPNFDGLKHFIVDIFPRLREGVELHVFGKHSDVILKDSELNGPGIFVHGFVEKLDDVWNCVDVMVVPVFSGAGANIKFAEILFNRVPVVVSQFVATQYFDRDSKVDGVFVCDADDQWVSTISSITESSLIPVPSEDVAMVFGMDNQVRVLTKGLGLQ